MCTQEFRSVNVTFKNASGAPITVKDFTSVIRRTGKKLQSGAADAVNSPRSYVVITDSDTENLLADGDIIDVSAVNLQTNQNKTAQFVVSCGKCACHINKISGPTEIVFDQIQMD